MGIALKFLLLLLLLLLLQLCCYIMAVWKCEHKGLLCRPGRRSGRDTEEASLVHLGEVENTRFCCWSPAPGRPNDGPRGQEGTRRALLGVPIGTSGLTTARIFVAQEVLLDVGRPLAPQVRSYSFLFVPQVILLLSSLMLCLSPVPPASASSPSPPPPAKAAPPPPLPSLPPLASPPPSPPLPLPPSLSRRRRHTTATPRRRQKPTLRRRRRRRRRLSPPGPSWRAALRSGTPTRRETSNGDPPGITRKIQKSMKDNSKRRNSYFSLSSFQVARLPSAPSTWPLSSELLQQQQRQQQPLFPAVFLPRVPPLFLPPPSPPSVVRRTEFCFPPPPSRTSEEHSPQYVVL